MTRRADLAKVHIARKELGLDEDTYRDVLARVTGQRSSADCSDAELSQVLDAFKSLGWTPKVVNGGKLKGREGKVIMNDPLSPYHQRPADHPSAKKARALWLSLWNLGEVRDPSETALEAFARRQLKVERLQWADQGQTYKLIEALKAMAERAGWEQSVADYQPGTDLVKVLKVNLVRAQEHRLGRRPQRVKFDDWQPDILDAYIRQLGEEIRCLPENAR